MAGVQSSTDLQHAKPEDLATFVTRFFKQLLTQFNGNIEFNKNIRSSSLLTAAFTTVSTDLTITHNLSRAPVGFLVVNSTVPMSVCAGSIAWSNSSITLQSNAVGTAMLYAI